MADIKEAAPSSTVPTAANVDKKANPVGKAPLDILPTGVLAIHIKRCKSLKLLEAGGKNFSKRLPVSLYMKVCIGESTKMTSVNDARCANNSSMIFDDLKHFLVSVNNKLDDESNKVTFLLMGYQGKDKHRKLGEKEVHLFNIIKNMFIVETLELTKNAHVIGEMEMEIAFSYGCFGYGHSSQLESKHHTPLEQVGQSLFFRAEPPAERKHETKDITTSIPVQHPPFINWPVKVNIGIGGRDYMTESISELISGKDRKTAENYPHLLGKLNKRLPELQKKYSRITKRSQRIAFLQNLVNTKINPELEEDRDEILFKEDDDGKYVSDTSLAGAVVTDADEDRGRTGLIGYVTGLFRLLIGSKAAVKSEQKPKNPIMNTTAVLPPTDSSGTEDVCFPYVAFLLKENYFTKIIKIMEPDRKEKFQYPFPEIGNDRGI